MADDGSTKRRRRGTRTDLSARRKRHRQQSETVATTSTSDSQSQSSILVSDFDHEAEHPSGIVPTETDQFSETPSEFYEETEGSVSAVISESESEHQEAAQASGIRSRKRKKSSLAYQRKGVKRKLKSTSEERDTIKTEDIDVNVSELADDEAHDIETVDEDYGCPDSTEEVSPSTTQSASLLCSNMKLLLNTDTWFIDVAKDRFVRLVLLNDSENARVKTSLCWDCHKNQLQVFVHGFPVPKENKVLLSRSFPVVENIGSVSDYLCALSNDILKADLCEGISEHDELWPHYPGSIDKTAAPCYRSAQCFVFVCSHKLCGNCSMDREKMRREQSRRDRPKVGSSHVKDEFLTKEEMKAKKDEWRGKYKYEKKRADRLQQRVDDLQVKLDEAMRDELFSILKANEHKMTEMQKIFWQSQREALCAKDKRGLRWHPMMIRIALRIRSLSDGALQFFHDSEILYLPSRRRLFDYSHFIEPAEGCQGEILQQLKEKIVKDGDEDHKYYVNLMLDEMHIRSGLVTKKSNGELVGYTNLTKVDQELEKLQNDLQSKAYKPALAKKVLVYLAYGITSTLKDVVAIYSTTDLSAAQLYDRSWEVIYFLEDAGIKVLTVTCDGAAINRKFIRMHFSMDSTTEHLYCTKNLASGDSRLIYFVVDPPHLLKTVRNAFANSFSHRKTRKLWKNGEFLSWQVIEKLYELTKNNKYRSHKLTKAHVTLSSFSCMTVLYATQVFSNSTAQSIEDLADHEAFELLDTRELVKFIRLMNRFFDCLNGKDELGKDARNVDLLSYTSSDDSRFAFLQGAFLDYFKEWKQDVRRRPGIFSESERARMIISYQALEALEITVKSVTAAIKYMLDVAKAPSVSARVFNQDALEQYFGKIRRQQGDNRNPTLKATLDTRLNLYAQGAVAMPSQKGNTEAGKDRKGLEVDSTPLLARKKPHKK